VSQLPQKYNGKMTEISVVQIEVELLNWTQTKYRVDSNNWW